MGNIALKSTDLGPKWLSYADRVTTININQILKQNIHDKV